MERRSLGQTGIEVSKLCLGTMTWGEQNTIEEAHLQLDYALERGINFIDTAEMYPVPPKAETYTKTESYIGQWGKIKTHRDQFVLATKIAGPGNGMPHVRGGKTRFNREHLTEAFHASLKRLNTEYIDLYQLHWPERQTNFFGRLGYVHATETEELTKAHETLEVLSTFIKEGKLKAVGLSNETPWGVLNFLRAAETFKLPKIVSIQNPYNLLNRSFEVGLSEISIREHVGLLAYSPLAFGVLSGKYLAGKKPANARLTLFDRFTRYIGKNGTIATERYVKLANDFGLKPAQMALAFVSQQQFVTSNIIGATNLHQLTENIDSAQLHLSDELLQAIDQIHQDMPNPCP